MRYNWKSYFARKGLTLKQFLINSKINTYDKLVKALKSRSLTWPTLEEFEASKPAPEPEPPVDVDAQPAAEVTPEPELPKAEEPGVEADREQELPKPSSRKRKPRKASQKRKTTSGDAKSKD